MTQKTSKFTIITSPESIESKIIFLRGHKVMLDKDLALLYGVETKVLNQAVKRNLERFPEDFMFQMTKEEFENWMSQFVTSSNTEPGSLRSQFVTLKQGQHRKYLPYAFTEQGIAMLSSVLNSSRAIQVNIQIMRTFTKLREMMAIHKDLKREIEMMEKKYDHQFNIVFEAIKKLLEPPEKPKGKIGFHP
ncbi:MAG: ORF6N domain-containing protein [Candidatus Omnitrophica bacterium]|nr:ORF6N domain-containing protein [Candidatus Omnitrophota bacterium]